MIPAPRPLRQTQHEMTYRRDIDGLRAVSILAVVGFHALPGAVPGGYVGVDIFFVISGFLISTIVIDELQAGTFSFAKFYGRRVRRIFPALSLVLAFCLALGWFLLFADEYEQLGKHVATAAAFVLNFVLRIEAGYFDVSAELKPLLHLWSLAIEEQFYLLWPVILLVAFRYRLVAVAIAIIFAISFGYNVLRVFSAPATAFYLPQSRLWELLTGAGLAHLTLSHRQWLDATLARRVGGCRAAEWLSGIGAGFIALAFVVLDRNSAFPGWWALLPTFGAAFLISAGSGAWINRTVLSSPAFVFIGLISYPLYLWHWPLLSFARIHYAGAVPPAIVGAAVLSSVLLAWLTYRFCETPIRTAPLRRSAPALIGVLLIVAAAGYVVRINGGVPARSANNAPDLDLARLDRMHELAVRSGTCHVNTPMQTIETFRRDAANCFTLAADRPNIIVIGDSHGGDLWIALSQAYPQYHLLQATGAGCDPAEEHSREFAAPCRGMLQFLRNEFLQTHRVDGIVLAARWKPSFRNIVPEIKRYQARGIPVMVIGPTYEFFAGVPKIIARKPAWQSMQQFLNDRLDHGRFAIDAEMRSYLAQAGVPYFSLIGTLCAEGQCPVFSAANELYVSDYGHWTVNATRDFGRRFADGKLLEMLFAAR